MEVIEIGAVAVIWAYVFLFLVFTVVAARRAGTSVWLFGVGAERQMIPAMLFRASFALGAALPLVTLWVLAGNPPWFLIPMSMGGAPSGLVGLILMITGAALALYAQHYMGRSWRIGAAEGHVGKIIDGGPFSFSRNPVFVGQVVLFAGLWLVFPTVAQCAVVAALILAAVLQVRIEERVLGRELGQPYADYRQRVRRWL